MKISVRTINFEHRKDINIPNEPFASNGRMIPTYVDEKWSYSVEKFEKPLITRFPDENYDYQEMAQNSVFIGAYDGDRCVGLAVMQKPYFKYMELFDIKVNAAYRNQGVGKLLIDKAKEVAAGLGYIGIYLRAQDNNLSACMFYFKSGFVIGGLDTKVYQGTPQENKKDIYFYLDF